MGRADMGPVVEAVFEDAECERVLAEAIGHFIIFNSKDWMRAALDRGHTKGIRAVLERWGLLREESMWRRHVEEAVEYARTKSLGPECFNELSDARWIRDARCA